MTKGTTSDIGNPLASGVVVFLLTDVEGSTERWEKSPEPMRLAIARHDHLLRNEIIQRGGHVFRTAGDAFYAAFASPADAIAAALAAQRALAAEDFSGVGGLSVRMAIHAGPVEARDGDYFGPGINRCARLLSVAYGGQILISGGAAEMASGYLPPQASLMDLGSHRLKNVSQPESVHQLVAPGLRWKYPSLRTLSATVHNLPQQLTSFVGCGQDLAEINSRFQRYRLVTLVGAGGAGKTRIALEIASQFLDKPIDGVWLVELASLEHPQLVAEALCSTIGVPVAGSRSATESAVGYLCRKRALLLLDNCEHLIGAVAPLVDALLRNCPSLLVLATSRERLGVQGESPYRVSSLAVPPSAGNITAAHALRYDAVRLFAERASAMVEGFAITDANAATVANICRQLDGIPLAIELVVPQLRMLRPQGLAAHLRDRLLAVKGDRTAMPRHQTLRSLFDWSYNLLTEDERRLFRRLAVFAGGLVPAERDDGHRRSARVRRRQLRADVGACRQVAGGGGCRARRTALQIPAAGARIRIPQAARKRRARASPAVGRVYSPDVCRGQRRLADNGHQRLADQIRSRARQSACLARLGLRAGGRCAARGRVVQSQHPDLGRAIALRRARALALDGFRTHGCRHACVDGGALVARQHLRQRAWNLDRALRAANLFREGGDQLGLGEALARAGAAVQTLESTAEAVPNLQEALAILRPLGPTKQLASCLRSLGVARYFVADFEGARPLIAQSEAVANRIGDARGLAAVQIAAAELEFAAGNNERAVAIVKSMLEGSNHNRRQMVLGLTNLASYLLACKKTNDAEQAALDALMEALALGWTAAVIRAVEHLALVMALGGNIEMAARLLGHGVAFYGKGTATREFTERASYKRLSDLLGSALPVERVAELMSEGALWTEDQAVKEITSLHPSGGAKTKMLRS